MAENEEREAERTMLAHALDRAGIHGCASYVQACNGPVMTEFPAGRARELAETLGGKSNAWRARARELINGWRDLAKTCGLGQAPVLLGCASDLDRVFNRPEHTGETPALLTAEELVEVSKRGRCHCGHLHVFHAEHVTRYDPPYDLWCGIGGCSCMEFRPEPVPSGR